MTTKEKVITILNDVTKSDYPEIFPEDMSDDEKLRMITSESIIALMFVTTIEDEFSVEFDDDEVDIDFFNSIDDLTNKIQQHLSQKN